jgi:hypothetical protein
VTKYHHFIVYANKNEHGKIQWHLDNETTPLAFESGPIYDTVADKWMRTTDKDHEINEDDVKMLADLIDRLSGIGMENS